MWHSSRYFRHSSVSMIEENFRWRYQLESTAEYDIKYASIQSALATRQNFAQSYVLAGCEHRNLALYTLNVTVCDETSKQVQTIELSINSSSIFVSGAEPARNFAADFDLPVYSYFQDFSSRKAYAKMLCQVLSSYYEGDSSDALGMEMIRFLEQYGQTRKVSNEQNYKFGLNYMHSEDLIMKHILFGNAIVRDIQTILSGLENCTILFANLFIHTRRDACCLCTRKVAAMVKHINKQNLSKALQTVIHSSNSLCSNFKIITVVSSQDIHKDRRIYHGHDEHTFACTPTIVNPRISICKKYYIQTVQPPYAVRKRNQPLLCTIDFTAGDTDSVSSSVQCKICGMTQVKKIATCYLLCPTFSV